jgi:large subunit ribosomal protein L32e
LAPSGYKAFLVHNPKDVELLLMHNRTYAAEYVSAIQHVFLVRAKTN